MQRAAMSTSVVMKEFTLTINGKSVTTIEKMSVICPATGEPFAECPIADTFHLEDAVNGSLDAFKIWRKTTMEERRSVMEKMALVLDENKEELGMLLSLENGKPLAEGIKEAGPRTAASLLGFSKMTLPIEVLKETPQQRVEVHRRPFGIVGCIIPWNFPLHSLFQKIAPAIHAGNVCIIKPSSETPLATLRAMELLKDIGPPGLLQTLNGPSSLGREIVRHPKIPKISFTGSTAVGIDVSRNAAEALKRLTLELGGNDAAIVLADVDVKEVAEGLARASFANSGQVCHALKRLYVHDSIYDPMLQALQKECQKFIVGHPLDEDGAVTHGPLTTKQQFDFIQELVDQAVASGARVVCGGSRVIVPGFEKGFYYAPTVIADVKEGIHRIVDEEQFGPVLPVLKFSDTQDALERANASEMGLTGSIWTKDEALGFELASQFEAGTGFVNHMSSSHGTTSSVEWPSQGYKMTGMGCNRGLLGLLEYTQPQTMNQRKL